MTWRSTTVPTQQLPALLATIRRDGGTVVSTKPQTDHVLVTWTVRSHGA